MGVKLNPFTGKLDVVDSPSGDFSTVELNQGTQTSPSISFDGDPNTGIYSPGADQLAISTNGIGRLFVDANGNVGINAAPPTATNAAGYREFLVKGGSTNRTGILRLQDGDGTDTVLLYANEVNGLELRQELARPISFWTNGTEKLRITSDGKLGLGTSSPAFNLVVQDTAIKPAIAIVGPTTDSANIYFGDSDSNAIGRISYNNANNSLTLRTNNFDALTIDSSQRVGIGTASPGANLQVQGSSTCDIRIRSSGANAPTSLQLWARNSTDSAVRQSHIIGTESGLSFATATTDNTTPTERARIDSSGRLLVGTSVSPSSGNGAFAKAVVQGNTADSTTTGYFAIQRGESASTITANESIGFLMFNDNAGNEFARVSCVADADAGSVDYPGRLVFSTTADGASSPTERMRIDSAGNVGIGTAIPSYLLTCATSWDGVDGVSVESPSVNGVIRLRADGTNGNAIRVGGVGAQANTLRFLVGSDVERARIDSSGRLLVGTSTVTANEAGKLVVKEDTASAIVKLQGNGTVQGAAQKYTIVRHYPVVSLGTKLIIPFVSQGNLNSTTTCKVWGHSARYNSNQPDAFEITFAVGHTSSLYNLASWGGQGNYASIAVNGMNIEISFTNAYTSATADGIFATIEFMTNRVDYSIDVANIAMN